MARGFRRKGAGDELRFTATLDALERATVAGLMDQVHAMLEPEQPETDQDDDDFSAIVAGLGMGVTVAPEDQADLDVSSLERDPALDRLLPTANRVDDEAAVEFRRLTETGLRQRKASALAESAEVLRHEDRIRLGEAQARTFLTALTDVRLVLGERMGLKTDDDLEHLEAVAAELDDDDPLGFALAIYDFLTWLQETLASAMLSR